MNETSISQGILPGIAGVRSAFSKAAHLAVMIFFLVGQAATARAVTIASAATEIPSS